MKPKLSWFGRISLLVLSPVVAFGLLEASLRVCGYRFEPWLAHNEGKTYDELSQKDIYEPHPDLLWTLRPSAVLDVEFLGFAGIRTNSIGIRAPELPGPKEPGELRILCLGDSVTFCLGLLQGETWSDRMEQALKASPELAGRKVSVINAAVPGYSSYQGMLQFDRLRHLEPDIVTFWFGLADAHEMYDLPDSAQRMPVEGVDQKLALLWNLRVFQLVQQVVTGVRSSAVEGTRVSREEYRANVERLLDIERDGGPRVIFVREPEICSVTIGQMERVVARAEEVGADLVVAPKRLLWWITPAPRDADLVGHTIRLNGQKAIRFEPKSDHPAYWIADVQVPLTTVRESLDELRALKRNFDRIVSGLPENCLTARDLFGDATDEQVFSDNCHLTPFGACVVGKAMAKEVLRRTRSSSD
jgi:lysophospholipase L1-like esterase